MRARPFPTILIFLGTMIAVTTGSAQSGRVSSSADITAPVEPSQRDIDETKLFSELLAHNEIRNAALAGYTEERTYAVTEMTGKVRAEESGQMEYRAPGKKTFVITS